MPNLDQYTTKLLDDLTEGERIAVHYRVGSEKETTADGHYAGLEKNSIGQWCVAVIGRHDARFRIPTDLVLSVKRK